jgi:hypothetical protein
MLAILYVSLGTTVVGAMPIAFTKKVGETRISPPPAPNQVAK